MDYLFAQTREGRGQTIPIENYFYELLIAPFENRSYMISLIHLGIIHRHWLQITWEGWLVFQ